MGSQGRGTAPSPETAAKYFYVACKAGDGVGCLNLGVAFRSGKGVPQDAGKSAQIMVRACKLGIQRACGQ